MLDKTKNAKDAGIATQSSSAINVAVAESRGFAGFAGSAGASQETNLHDKEGYRFKTLAELIGDRDGAVPAHMTSFSAREAAWSPELDTYHQLPGLRSFWPPG